MFNNIVLATDFSDHSETAKKAAISMAKGEDKKLTVVHVFDAHQKMVDEGVFISSELVEAAETKHFRRESQSEMEKYCRDFAEHHIHFDTMVLSGKASDMIIKTAKDIEADLIIIGSHSKKGFIDVSLGGVTRKVGELASCPVLIVTHFDEDKDEEEDETEADEAEEPKEEEKEEGEELLTDADNNAIIAADEEIEEKKEEE